MSRLSVLGDIFDILVTVWLNYELNERPKDIPDILVSVLFNDVLAECSEDIYDILVTDCFAIL
jgi:hypothetical protein